MSIVEVLSIGVLGVMGVLVILGIALLLETWE